MHGSGLTPGAQVAAAIDILGRDRHRRAAGRRHRRRLFPPPALYRRQGPGCRSPAMSMPCCATAPRSIGGSRAHRKARSRPPRAAAIIAALVLIDRLAARRAVAASFDGDRFRPPLLSARPRQRLARGLAGRTLTPSGDAARRRERSAGLARTAISHAVYGRATRSTRWRRSTRRRRSICASMC